MAATIVISRRWHQPAITVRHLGDGVSVEMTTEDFARAFAQALVLPWWRRLFRWNAAVEPAASAAFEAVAHEMKMATAQAPPPPPPPIKAIPAHRQEI